jgi:hypothetical protein
MVNGEWSYSMLPFGEEERKGSSCFRRGKDHARWLSIPAQMGNRRI